MSKILVFDLDGVLVNFYKGFSKTAQALFLGKKPVPIIEHAKLTTWDQFVVEGILTPEEYSYVWETLKSDPDWWIKLEPMAPHDVFYRINDLQFGNHVYFVTSRGSYHNAQKQSCIWLEDHGIYNPSVVVTKRKGEFCKTAGVDYALEDKAENAWVIHWFTEGKTASYLIDRAYNQVPNLPVIGTPKVKRVKSVGEFLDVVEG